MNQDQGVGPAGGDQRSGDHCLAECRGCRQHTGVVPQQRARGSLLLRCQLAFEGRCDRTTAVALVAGAHDDAQRREHRLYLVAAAAGQGYVVRQQLRAADDARDAEGRQAHPLGAVELGILKRGEAGQPIDEGGGQPGAVDVYLVAEHHLDGLGQGAGYGCLRSPPGRRCKPRGFVFLHHRQAYSDYAPAPSRFVGQVGDLGGGHASDRRQVPPLVGMWPEVGVEEYAVARQPWPVLQGQRDEIAESARRKRVLVGKQSVVGFEPDVRVPFHRLGKQPCSKAPSRRRRDRISEEDPHVAAVAGAGSFQRGRQLPALDRSPGRRLRHGARSACRSRWPGTSRSRRPTSGKRRW